MGDSVINIKKKQIDEKQNKNRLNKFVYPKISLAKNKKIKKTLRS